MTPIGSEPPDELLHPVGQFNAKCRRGKSIQAIIILITGVLLAAPWRGRAATVAYYRFQEGTNGMPAIGTNSIIDSSGNGLNATPISSPTYSNNVPASPIVSNTLSLLFNGTSSRIFIPDYPQLSLTNSLTLEAYIEALAYPDSAINESQIIFRGDDDIGRDPYFIELRSTNLFFGIASGSQLVSLQAPINLHQWHHVAGTLDGATGNMGLYLDGNLVAATNTALRPYKTLVGLNPGLGIGNVQSANYAEYFKGFIDAVRVSDTALLPGQFLNAERVVILGSPVIVGGNLELSFNVVSGNVQSFALLQTSQLTEPWTTNYGAILSTNGPNGYSFLVPTPTNPAQFYRLLVQ
jgi:hypothetical protein